MDDKKESKIEVENTAPVLENAVEEVETVPTEEEGPEATVDAETETPEKSFHLGGKTPNPWSTASSISSGLFLIAMVFVTGGFVFSWFFSQKPAYAEDLFMLITVAKYIGIPYFVCSVLSGVCWVVARNRAELKSTVNRSLLLFIGVLLGFPGLLFVLGLVRLLQAYSYVAPSWI